MYADDCNVGLMCRSGLLLGNVVLAFSLTRDPINTLELSAYIGLISVACALNQAFDGYLGEGFNDLMD